MHITLFQSIVAQVLIEVIAYQFQWSPTIKAAIRVLITIRFWLLHGNSFYSPILFKSKTALFLLVNFQSYLWIVPQLLIETCFIQVGLLNELPVSLYSGNISFSTKNPPHYSLYNFQTSLSAVTRSYRCVLIICWSKIKILIKSFFYGLSSNNISERPVVLIIFRSLLKPTLIQLVVIWNLNQS